MLFESAAMNAAPPRNDALDLLRAIFDLADADVHADARLLGRLTGQEPARINDLLGWLETRGLLQHGQRGLTMAGLIIATGLPPFELAPMTAPPRAAASLRRAA